jgi:uncharacterized HAD superfamily protein
MLEEYKQIANAYQDLHAQHNELVSSYLTMVALPASVLAIVAQFFRAQSGGSAPLMDTVSDVALPILLFLMAVLCLVGIAVIMALVTTRAEALLYVRTVNCVRRYFVENDPSGYLHRYLVLPHQDDQPRFWEGLQARSFWNVGMVALLNTGLFFATFFSWATWRGHWGRTVQIQLALAGCACWLALQYLVYWGIMKNRENGYHVKFSAPFTARRKILGTDLDGTLNDLAGAVIRSAKTKYGLDIALGDITSHRLQDCTDLTREQVEEIFTSPATFGAATPDLTAKDTLDRLSGDGWTVQIVTDRFWGKTDWRAARDWLEEHGFTWDHLNLVRAEEKAAYCDGHGITIFVEDNYDTALTLSSVCDEVFLLNRPYNRGHLPDNVTRVASWQDIEQELLGKAQ